MFDVKACSFLTTPCFWPCHMKSIWLINEALCYSFVTIFFIILSLLEILVFPDNHPKGKVSFMF